jgi:predicted lipoprotein
LKYDREPKPTKPALVLSGAQPAHAAVHLARLYAVEEKYFYTLKTARSISLPLHKAVRDEQQHEQVERLKAQVLALLVLVRGRISTAVGMGTGFNFLDGD